jgi:hypothetical protein
MKKIVLTFLFVFSLQTHCSAQVGIGTTNPETSAILDVSSNSKALLVPRILNTSLVTNPVNGMIVYDRSCECFKGFENGAWEKLVNGTEASASVTNNCELNGFEGLYLGGQALDASNKFSVTITNNSFTDANFATSLADLQLSGSGLGTASVSSVSPPTISLIPGQSQLVEYSLSGTPVTGNLNASWTKFGLNCSIDQNVANGFASFQNDSYKQFVFSVNDPVVSIDNQGVFTSGTVINVPYSSGVGSYDAYTSAHVSIPAQFSEDGESDWTFSYEYSMGNFASSGNIPVTLKTYKSGVEANWLAKKVNSISIINFNVVSIPFVVNGNQTQASIGLDEGGDAIRGALVTAGCASCAAYDAAQVNDWIQITEAEYNQMNTSISNNFVGGTQEAFFSNIGGGVAYGANGITHTIQFANGTQTVEVPVNQYFYAFKIQYFHTNLSNVQNVEFISGPINTTTNQASFVSLGNVLPTHNITNRTGYYLIKRNSIQTSSAVNIGIITNTNYQVAASTTNGTAYSGSASPVSVSPWPNTNLIIQSLSSSVRQW